MAGASLCPGSIDPAVTLGVMDIQPVPLAQVKLGADGRQYEVSGEAGRIAQRVTELDPSLRVRFVETGGPDVGFFVIYQLIGADRKPRSSEHEADGESLVMRVPMAAWDDRVMKELEPRAWDIRHGISRAAVLDADDDRRMAAIDAAIEEESAANAAPLFRAIQREFFSSSPRAFIRSGLGRA